MSKLRAEGKIGIRSVPPGLAVGLNTILGLADPVTTALAVAPGF